MTKPVSGYHIQGFSSVTKPFRHERFGDETSRPFHRDRVSDLVAGFLGDCDVRVFASWSGDESRQIAELLKSWLPLVLQEADVYVSSQDIGKGERWQANLGRNLAEIDFGVVVITKTNINAPWILFEAGALSKSVKGLVVPLLCGVENVDIATSPLSQFQYAKASFDDMKDFVLQVNSCSANPLETTRVERAFLKWWPEFESHFAEIELHDDKPAKKETEAARLSRIEETLSEVLLEMRRSRQSTTGGQFDKIRSGIVGAINRGSEPPQNISRNRNRVAHPPFEIAPTLGPQGATGPDPWSLDDNKS